MVLSKDNQLLGELLSKCNILHVTGYLYLKVVFLQPVHSNALQNLCNTFTKMPDDIQILT